MYNVFYKERLSIKGTYPRIQFKSTSTLKQMQTRTLENDYILHALSN